jgi:hypothetical protein
LITRHRLAAVFATFLLAAAAGGQTPKSLTPKASTADLELENAIRARFARSKSAEDKFTIRVLGGVATIEGKTSVLQRKSAATRMAKSAGAKQVVNKVVVDEAARRKAASALASGRRRAQVKRSEAGANRAQKPDVRAGDTPR